MKVTTFGTRGSVPVAGKQFGKYGGNTTCLLVESQCLPKEMRLVIDAGTGIMPACETAKDITHVVILFTHYHYDHVQGLLLADWTYIKEIPVELYGPEENGTGPRQMMEEVMRPPYHPVNFKKYAVHFKCKGIEQPDTMVFIIHPVGGLRLIPIEELDRAANNGCHSQITFGPECKYPLEDCLVIRMYRSNHPERTISYRFEERPTGKVLVLLTDNENHDSLPAPLRSHLTAADLLIMDSQYDRRDYDTRTAGYGHGTPDYCVATAKEASAKILGLTHHDPKSSDKRVDQILQEGISFAQENDYEGQVIACRDHQVFQL